MRLTVIDLVEKSQPLPNHLIKLKNSIYFFYCQQKCLKNVFGQDKTWLTSAHIFVHQLSVIQCVFVKLLNHLKPLL